MDSIDRILNFINSEEEAPEDARNEVRQETEQKKNQYRLLKT